MKLFGKSEKENKPPKPPKPSRAPPPPKPPGRGMGAGPVKLPPLKMPQPERLPQGSPPLFIKVDKYRDVLKNIRNLRSYILNLRDALDVLEDIQKELANGVHVAQKTVDELNMILSSLDSFFLKPHAVEHEDIEEMEEREEEAYRPHHPEAPAPREMEGYVKDVYGELEKLRNQLKSIG
ncbi:MAG: hypothetical protein GTN38_04780 [Candidatus Aenigmarchaeota archaeon]|nr:hypothetical protein [Candidatus Aenigmarchaeota archaeon]NIP41061.1 hypothetical protein [Candidatus Aenigmarchaeota archaeon]NIQ17463.1 hypothetical protein [Candidatus Aenigmarchaeota archaeon]NIS73657.1 hypothetical protein [Candidatus Aenigmarchaeota archaeon]